MCLQRTFSSTGFVVDTPRNPSESDVRQFSRVWEENVVPLPVTPKSSFSSSFTLFLETAMVRVEGRGVPECSVANLI